MNMARVGRKTRGWRGYMSFFLPDTCYSYTMYEERWSYHTDVSSKRLMGNQPHSGYGIPLTLRWESGWRACKQFSGGVRPEEQRYTSHGSGVNKPIQPFSTYGSSRMLKLIWTRGYSTGRPSSIFIIMSNKVRFLYILWQKRPTMLFTGVTLWVQMTPKASWSNVLVTRCRPFAHLGRNEYVAPYGE